MPWRDKFHYGARRRLSKPANGHATRLPFVSLGRVTATKQVVQIADVKAERLSSRRTLGAGRNGRYPDRALGPDAEGRCVGRRL